MQSDQRFVTPVKEKKRIDSASRIGKGENLRGALRFADAVVILDPKLTKADVDSCCLRRDLNKNNLQGIMAHCFSFQS